MSGPLVDLGMAFQVLGIHEPFAARCAAARTLVRFDVRPPVQAQVSLPFEPQTAVRVFAREIFGDLTRGA